jgi:hypothetical protein
MPMSIVNSYAMINKILDESRAPSMRYAVPPVLHLPAFPPARSEKENKMLNTEKNTATIERVIRSAALAAKLGPAKDLQTDFEHGQWWVTNRASGAQWSVCDTNTGFDFECVTRGEGE